MSGIHFVFRKNPKNGELKLLNMAQTIHEAENCKKEQIRTKRYLPSSVIIMEQVG
jgi:hypothetical protein